VNEVSKDDNLEICMIIPGRMKNCLILLIQDSVGAEINLIVKRDVALVFLSEMLYL